MRGMWNCLPLRFRRSIAASYGVVVFAALGLAQGPKPVVQAKPTALAPPLAADSYAIYSELLPGHDIEWGDVPRAFWLMEQ